MAFDFYIWNRSPKAKYIFNRKEAKKRGIKWNLTFEEWWKLWSDSGHWEERGYGKNKYCLCRKKDLGNYEVGNIYIDLATNNCRDAWYNGKSQHLPDPKLSFEQRQNIYKLTRDYTKGLSIKLAKEFGVSPGRIRQIRDDDQYSCNTR